MIIIDESSPRWLRELNRFIHLKGLLLIHGNVLDLVSYQVRATAERTYWTEGNLADFFPRLLQGMGYRLVGRFDPVDGMGLAAPEMHRQLEEVLGRKPAQAAPPARGQGGELLDLAPLLEDFTDALANRKVPTAFVINFASRLTASPDRLSAREQALFTRILKASLAAREVIDEAGRWNNLLILICDKINDLPPFLYLENPRARSIFLDKPGIGERSRFLRSNYGSFFGAEREEQPPRELVSLFSALTEGFSYYEMLSLVGLSQREHIPVSQIRNLSERFKYGVVESDWDKIERGQLEQAGDSIRGRIKGQEPAVGHLLEIIKRAKLGLAAGSSNSQRPRGVLFFAGPTGVGKTEMAKGLAELLFGQEERLIRFDMSEYAQPHADQKLLGAPPGYVGYEEGGKLTNAMQQQPFSVLLFDEVEKAHPSIFDKFLQILDDGRLTDGKGETVYFSECIIIFTSNLGAYAAPDAAGDRERLISPDMPYSVVRETILAAIRHHFNQVLGRPEILNRFGENFVVFDFIRPPVDELILDRLLGQLAAALRESRQIELEIAPQVRQTLIALGREHLDHGGRGLRNMLEAALVNPLASRLFDDHIAAAARLRLSRLIDHGPEVQPRFGVEIRVQAPPAV